MRKYGKVLDYSTVNEAVLGKKYAFGDRLKVLCNNPEDCLISTLSKIHNEDADGFIFESGANGFSYQFCREVIGEEVLMTNRQLVEWLAKGNGQVCHDGFSDIHTHYIYGRDHDCEEVDKELLIRSWDSDEWVEPTLEIYERDCKKVNA